MALPSSAPPVTEAAWVGLTPDPLPIAQAHAFTGRPQVGWDARVRHRLDIVRLAEASAHRDLAFRRCHRLIDRLKADSPIWNRDLLPDA